MIDFKSSQWAQVEEMLTGRMDALKEQLTRPTLTETETAVLRGGIKEVRNILNWPQQHEPNQKVEGIEY